MLARLDGVGDVRIFGARDYAMRIWLDPEKVASRNLTARRGGRGAPRAERPGRLRRGEPAAGARAGRLSDQRRDARASLRSAPVRQHRGQDRRRRPRDAARGHRDASSSRRRTTPPTAISTRCPAVPLLVFQRPGSNALATADRLHRDDGGAVEEFSAGRQIRHRLQPDRVHRRVRATRWMKTIWEAVDPRRHRRRPVPADLAGGDHPDRRDSDLADRHLHGDGGARLFAEHICRCSASCSPSASSSTTPSSWWRTSSGSCAPASRRRRRRTAPWTRSAARSSPSRWCSAPCSSRRR